MRCPCCDVDSRADPLAIELTFVYESLEIGEYSLAGVMFKVPMRRRLQLRCTACGWRIRGYIDPRDGKFAGKASDAVWPADRPAPARCPQCGEPGVQDTGEAIRCDRCPFDCPRATP